MHGKVREVVQVDEPQLGGLVRVGEFSPSHMRSEARLITRQAGV